MKKKIILFGGTFDPIHNGHIQVACSAMKEICADQLIFIPAKRSPHKKDLPVASDKDRLEMITLAIAAREDLSVSDCEFHRSQPSYTLDTVMYFKKHYGQDSELYWLVGADVLKDLCSWHKICDLIDQCNLSVMRRGGVELPQFWRLEPILGKDRVSKLKSNVISTPLIEISSTEIRSRLASSQDLSDMLDEKVIDYIFNHGLYR